MLTLLTLPLGGSFSVCLGFYLVVGFAYQRFIVGASGLEQIPNLHFWLDVLDLAMVRVCL